MQSMNKRSLKLKIILKAKDAADDDEEEKVRKSFISNCYHLVN